jgi:hypothetical protein
MKKEFLAVYDYGTAGAWACLLADSAAQIHERFPKPHVVTDRPGWLTDEEDRHLRERMPSTSMTPRTGSSPRSSSNEIDRRSTGLDNCLGSSKRALAARRSRG